jgi:hypothetical protein
MAQDLSEFVQLSQRIGKKQLCEIPRALEALQLKEERDQLVEALGADKLLISAGAIATWLSRRGVDVSRQKIASHRARTCTCHVS